MYDGTVYDRKCLGPDGTGQWERLESAQDPRTKEPKTYVREFGRSPWTLPGP